MKYEEELQRKVESGEVVQGSDADAYAAIYRALSTKEASSLPRDFADCVVLRLAEKKAGQISAAEYFLIFGGAVSFIIVLIIAIAFAKSSLTLDFGSANGYFGLFLFAAAVMAGFHFLDRKLFPKRALV